MQSSKTKGALNGKQKRSIFAVPDSLSGRVCPCIGYSIIMAVMIVVIQVGVGTCNIGGKGMTDFSIPAKNAASKDTK